ncbi:heme biosynthesis operon protein HemX [Stutzerimonas urumqiensis]|uniref:uroporphyrinogen-III C-methyltransferase n=1 Tax=Stutzerimonas urumqiensis TaxID=638269 RepID=UPI003BAB8BF9
MSEEQPGKKPDTAQTTETATTATPSSRTPAPSASARTSAGGGKALATLALLIGAGGLLAGGYSLVQLQRVAEHEQRLQALDGTAERTEQLARQEQALAARLTPLEQLPSADELDERRRLLGSLQSDMQDLSGRVEQVLGASREQWRLAEAEHLMRMAMLRLSAMQDVESAKALIREADLILRKQDDPGAFAARQELIDALEALRSLPDIDRTGLFLQLGALTGQASSLRALAPGFEPGASVEQPQGQSAWKRWLNELTRYVRVDFNASGEVKPLLAGQTLGQVRLALSLAFEQAQWAVLNANEEVYRQSLAQARAILTAHFSEENAARQALIERIDALSERQVAVQLPSLAPAMQALRAYVDEQQAARDEAPSVSPATDEPAPQPVEPPMTEPAAPAPAPAPAPATPAPQPEPTPPAAQPEQEGRRT